jgi:hypothetical protein
MSENKIVADGNEECIAPIRAGVFVIGLIDEIHGRGALEVPEFIPSQYELMLLVKHWEKVKLDNLFFWHYCQSSSSSGSREVVFANLRINRIADAVKDDAAITKAIDEATEEFRKEHMAGASDDLLWRTFIGTATPEEQKKFEAERDAMLSGGGEAPSAQETPA